MIQYGKYVKSIMMKISDKYDFEIIEMEVDKDHIHLMLESEPQIFLLMIVRILKQQTTIELWRLFPQYLIKHFLQMDILFLLLEKLVLKLWKNIYKIKDKDLIIC